MPLVAISQSRQNKAGNSFGSRQREKVTISESADSSRTGTSDIRNN